MTELRMAKPIDSSLICAELDRAHSMGIGKVTFLGGEPTIQRGFMDCLKYAVSLDFDEIVIFTNGVRLWRREWIEEVLGLGGNIAWRISLQGADEETHDFTTKKKGAFAKIVKGLGILSDIGQKISVNMCVVEENYRSLHKLPAMVEKYDIWQVHLDMFRPRDAGDRTDDYLDGCLPDYTDLARELRVMLTGFDVLDPDYDINIGNLPYCLMPEFAHKVHHEGNLTFTVAVDGQSTLSEPWNKYEDKSSDKLKLESCQDCSFHGRCSGFFELYAKQRGVEEFQPVPRAKLTELDPQQKLFVFHLEPALELVPDQPVPGWKVTSRRVDEHQRRVDFDFARGSGETIHIHLLPAMSLGGGDAEHENFVLRLASYNVPDHEALTVARELFRAVAKGCPGNVTVVPNLDRIRARRQVFGPGSMVPVNVQRRLRRIVKGGPIPGWKIVGAHPMLDKVGAYAVMVSQDGDEATLELVQSEEGRVQVSWHFLDEERDVAARRTMIQNVKSVLKGQRHVQA